MKLVLSILVLVFASKLGFTQNKIATDSLIEWNKSIKLKWTDFKGNPPEDKNITIAETQCYVKFIEIYYDINNVPKFTIKCYFGKNQSWSIVSDLETLKHEQLHFDLWELVTRKIRKEFSELNNENEKNISVYYNKYSELMHYGIELQNQYDNESYFSEKGQNYWNDKILNGLKELNKYDL